MRLITQAICAAAVALTFTVTAQAGDPVPNSPRYSTLGSFFFRSHQKPLPTYQAAPWYLYWPYDGHFLTPAPIHAPFMAPPVTGNFPVNPYFPAPAGAYGPIPGGPAPSGIGH